MCKTIKQRVTFKSGSLTLVGYLFKPAGRGPFPAVLWNHGSERNPGGGPRDSRKGNRDDGFAGHVSRSSNRRRGRGLRRAASMRAAVV